jgi:vitamin B12 transporter
MKTVNSGARFAALGLALVASVSSVAQDITAGSLQEVVVTASRNPQLLSAASAHTTLITREDIEKSQATDVISLLQLEAGLQRSQNGGIGTVSALFMRGLPALDTLVLIDGVPQNKQDESGSVSLEHVMLDNVERVEIVRGNVSAIYGSGAIGGVIQIFTRAPQKEPSARFSLEVGPRGTAKLGAQASVAAGETAISAGVSRLTTNGFSAVNNQQYPTANPDDNGYQNVSANASISHRVTRDHQLGLQLLQSEGNTAYDSNSSFSVPTDTNRSVTRMNQATVYSDDSFGTWRSRLSYSEQTEKSVTYSHGSFEAQYGFNTRVGLARWVNTLPIGSDWLGTAGFEEQRQHVDTNDVDPSALLYDKDRNAHAVFVGLEGCFGPTTLQVNLRTDSVGDQQQGTGYLGAGYSITDSVKVTASTSTAFNAPPLGYLYYPYGGNTSLKPELAQSGEVGLQYASANQLLRATYFDTRVQDQLSYDLSTSTFTNIKQARNTGLELSYKGSVNKTDLRASLTAQNPVNDITGAALDRRSRTMLNLGVSHPVSQWRFGADLRYASESSDTYTDSTSGATVSTTLRAYTVVDVSAAYRYSRQLQFTSRIDNLTNENYQTVYGYNQQPFSVYVGAVWTPHL